MADESKRDGKRTGSGGEFKKDRDVKIKVLGEDVVINPFVPKFMAETPWYMSTSEDASNGSVVKKRTVRQVCEDPSTEYDAKRDRWSKYDASEFDKVIDQHKEVDITTYPPSRHNDDDIDDLSEAAEKIGTGSLRIREDITPYLDVNADVSLQYNPKSRAMVKMKNDNATDEFVAAGSIDDKVFSWNKQTVLDSGKVVEEQLEKQSFEAVAYDDDLIERYAPIQNVSSKTDDDSGEVVNNRKFVPSRTTGSSKDD